MSRIPSQWCEKRIPRQHEHRGCHQNVGEVAFGDAQGPSCDALDVGQRKRLLLDADSSVGDDDVTLLVDERLLLNATSSRTWHYQRRKAGKSKMMQNFPGKEESIASALEKETSRLEAFSDGVFAIAITLLAVSN